MEVIIVGVSISLERLCEEVFSIHKFYGFVRSYTVGQRIVEQGEGAGGGGGGGWVEGGLDGR